VPRGAAVGEAYVRTGPARARQQRRDRALAREHGARDTRVVHLGSDLPAARARGDGAADRHASAISSRASATPTCCALVGVPGVRYLVIGDGPEREPLERLAVELGVAERVEFAGQLDPEAALARSREAWLFVLPSTEEAFGVAYIEAMAAGIPAIGCSRRARTGGDRRRRRRHRAGPPRDPAALAAAIARAAGRPGGARRSARGASDVERSFTWRRCGEQTLAAYDRRAAMKPVLFITGHVPASRARRVRALHERVPIELALYGGPPPARRAAGPAARGVPSTSVDQREVGALIAQRRLPRRDRRHRRARGAAARLAGRAAPGPVRLLGRAVAHAARRRAPRGAAADAPDLPRGAAVVTYGPHVSAYVARTARTADLRRPAGGRQRVLVAPAGPRGDRRFAALFVGRAEREKGLAVAARRLAARALDPAVTADARRARTA
jgi:hypothetical protein